MNEGNTYACPASLWARHWYSPVSEVMELVKTSWFVFVWIMRPFMLTARPFLYHVTRGGGWPETTQSSRAVLASKVSKASGGEMISGGTMTSSSISCKMERNSDV